MRIPMWQVDAFTGAVFAGNPAAVCPLERWLEPRLMQAIAAENNLSETAFFVRAGGGAQVRNAAAAAPARGPSGGAPAPGGAPGRADDFEIRWFTPAAEIDLCGHATLASAWVVLHRLEPARAEVTFHSQSGPLTVRRDGERLAMEFPARPPAPCEPPAGLAEALGRAPRAVLQSRDVMAVYETEEEVRGLAPSFDRIRALGLHGVIVTAPGCDCDFVSRFFAPLVGVPEDPVTGSAHCNLIPYWSARLGKKTLHARQVSARGGELFCEDRGATVIMAGRVAPYLQGTIEVPE
ncbi:MAG: PhzF family phenazine biosynthesis protein [Candidatus Eisenbacteria bacterium]|nr:PhzF family phenazine biosynthesis protein [Candidatus Eisenbacteria bacterium]